MRSRDHGAARVVAGGSRQMIEVVQRDSQIAGAQHCRPQAPRGFVARCGSELLVEHVEASLNCRS
jgi:hypothetical protein